MIWLNKNFLKIDDSEIIELPLSFHCLLELKDMVIVVVGLKDNESMEHLEGRNVFSYNRRGKQLWQIQKQGLINGRIHEYDNVMINKEGKITVGANWGGDYFLNIEDGSITPCGGRPW
jgi:hypothetical protein